MSFLSALSFLTVLPVGRGRAPAEMGRSLPFFPLVGLLLGLALAGLSWGLARWLPLGVVNALLIASLAIFTGGLHLDGFIDTCDGLVGMRTPEDRWKVMKDSRVGGFGAIGAVLLLLTKYASLSDLPHRSQALILMPVVGRWAGVLAVLAFPYAKPQGLGRAFKEGATPDRFLVATLVALAIAVTLLRLEGLVLMAGVGVLAWTLAWFLKSRFAGLTGDNYGAVIEASEVIFLLLVHALGGGVKP